MIFAVAPFTGAWIEMFGAGLWGVTPEEVAPFTGAWIEILLLWNVGDIQQGRSLHGSVD